MNAADFGERFDAGEDMSAYVDWTNARRTNRQAKWINVDFPVWAVAGLAGGPGSFASPLRH